MSIQLLNTFHYINTCEIPGFFLLLKKHLHCEQWRYYFYLSRVRILVLPRLLKRSPLVWLHNPLKSNLMCYYMIETPSVLPWKSSVMFRNLGRFSENVRKWLSGLRTTFWESLEIFGKCLEIFGESSKKSSLVSLYNKQNITRPLVHMNFIFSCSTRNLMSERSKQVRYCVELPKMKFISTHGHVISSISYSIENKPFCFCNAAVSLASSFYKIASYWV